MSVVTPVYNTEPYLAQCIESVLAQTHRHFEYLIVDNASTDRSLAVARSYAAQDPRIRIVACTEHLPQASNYNRALAAISPDSLFVKLVQADDWLFPHCIADMLAVSFAHPQVGIVGSLHLMANGAAVEGRGLAYPCTNVAGTEIVRRELLDGAFHALGTPTTVMYRSAAVRAHPNFFPTDSMSMDTVAAFRTLQEWNFSFVHQVLAWLREDDDSISSRNAALRIYEVEALIRLQRFGHAILSEEEFGMRRDELVRAYRRMLGSMIVKSPPTGFWEFHYAAASQAGIRLSRGVLARSFADAVWAIAANPGRLWHSRRRRTSA